MLEFSQRASILTPRSTNMLHYFNIQTERNNLYNKWMHATSGFVTSRLLTQRSALLTVRTANSSTGATIFSTCQPFNLRGDRLPPAIRRLADCSSTQGFHPQANRGAWNPRAPHKESEEPSQARPADGCLAILRLGAGRLRPQH